jgi:hypothetical protein
MYVNFGFESYTFGRELLLNSESKVSYLPIKSDKGCVVLIDFHYL